MLTLSNVQSQLIKYLNGGKSNAPLYCGKLNQWFMKLHTSFVSCPDRCESFCASCIQRPDLPTLCHAVVLLLRKAGCRNPLKWTCVAQGWQLTNVMVQSPSLAANFRPYSQKKFSARHEIRQFLPAFTRVHLCFLSWAIISATPSVFD